MDNENARHLELGQQESYQNFRTCYNIIKDEIAEAWRKMKAGKTVGPDSMALEI